MSKSGQTKHKVRIKLDFIVETEHDPNPLIDPRVVLDGGAASACEAAYIALAMRGKLEGKYHILSGSKINVSRKSR